MADWVLLCCPATKANVSIANGIFTFFTIKMGSKLLLIISMDNLHYIDGSELYEDLKF